MQPRTIQAMEASDEAEHNWDKVLCKYGSVGRAIEAAFLARGYGRDQLRAMILRAIRETGWAKSKIAHSLGNSQSGIRGGTIEKINKCKAAVLDWLERNPSGGVSSSGGSKKWTRGRRKEREEEEQGYDLNRVFVLQFVKDAKEGDEAAIHALVRRAARGNSLACTALLDLYGAGVDLAGLGWLETVTPLRDLPEAWLEEARRLLSWALLHLRSVVKQLKTHEDTFWSLTKDVDLVPLIATSCEHCISLSRVLEALARDASPVVAGLVGPCVTELAEVIQSLETLRRVGDSHTVTIRLADVRRPYLRLALLQKRLG